jgi:hypothetical protein
MNERGQTANDYLIGIIIVLVTIVAVFGYFPSIFDPFEDPIGSDERAMADNLADEVIANNTVAGTQQTLNQTAFETELENNVTLKQRAGIKKWRQINVTIEKPGTVLIRGDDDDNFAQATVPAATTVRFVRLADHPECNDGCYLIVRVW